MKKILAILLSAVIMIGMLAACVDGGDEDTPVVPTPSPAPAPEITPPPPDEIVEGDWLFFEQPTEPAVAGRPSTPSGMLTIGENVISADFMAGWGNPVGNARARELMAGYDTVVQTAAGHFILNPMAVRGFLMEVNDDQSRTYTIQIHDNLLWSDGTPITAADYVFGMLYSSSPYVLNSPDDGGLGASLLWAGNDRYTGGQAYRDGDITVHPGFRLIDEHTFSANVDFETDGEPNFPNWWAVSYYNFGPSAMHVIAPGVSVVDTGTGVTLEGPWGIDLLQSTVEGPNGFRYAPTVSAGPYVFVSFDEADVLARFTVNPNFLGDYLGFRPMIENILMRQVTTGVAVEEFQTGGIDLFVNASSGAVINALLDFASGRNDVGFFNFPRNGYGFVDIKHHIGPTQFVEVRRALALTLDREEAGRIWTGGHGVVVQSEIGLAQWMYTENQALVDSSLIHWSVNIDRAIEELESGGWTLDAEGNDFVLGESDNPRHKRLDDGTLMPLHMNWFAANEQVGDMLYSLWVDNMAEVGMTYTYFHSSDFERFQDAVYAREFPDGITYNIVSRGADFAAMPHQWFNYDITLGELWNTNFIDDPRLLEYARRMRDTEPGDFDTYFEHWLNFVVYVNEIVVDLWLYSDMRHTFYYDKLNNFSHSATFPYTFALIRAWVT